MSDNDLLFKIIAQDEYAANMQRAREMVDNMTETEKKSIAVASQHQAVESSLADAMDVSTEAKRRATDQLARLDQQYQSGEISATEYAAGVDKIKENLGKASSSGLNWTSVLTGINQGMELASKVGRGLGDVYNALVGDTMKYAGQVKDLSLNLGLSTEETSKLLGVAQKFGVSNETLTNSLEMMVKRGLAPSLDGLAKLSDRMMAIQNPVERAHQLSELFGRGWTNLMPILEKGSAGIHAAANEAEAFGKVLSQETTDAVENLEIQANTLTERLDGLKTQIGSRLIPILNDAAGAFDNLFFGQEKLDRLFVQHAKDIVQTSKTYEDYEAEWIRTAVLTNQAKEATALYTQEFLDSKSAQDKAALGLVMINDQYYKITGTLDRLTTAQFDNARSLKQETEAQERNLEAAQATASSTQDQIDRQKENISVIHDAFLAQQELANQADDIADRAIVYAEQNQKMADLKQKLADLDAQIASQGSAYIATEANKQMTAEQRAVAEANLARAIEDVGQAQRKKGETDAEYNARLVEAKAKVSELSNALGSHSVVLGGATKAQLEDKAAIEGQITAMLLQDNKARAMEGVKALGQALKDHTLNAQEYSDRMAALNRVTGLYSNADLVAATNQQIFIDKLTNPKAGDWYNVLQDMHAELNTQYIPAVKTTTTTQETHRQKMTEVENEYSNVGKAVDATKLKQDEAASVLTTKVNAAHSLHVKKLQDEEGEFNNAEGFVQRYIDKLLAIPTDITTNVHTNYTTTGAPPAGSSGSDTGGNDNGGDDYGKHHAAGVHMVIPPNYNDTYPLGFGKSGEEFYVGPPDQRAGPDQSRSVYHQETVNIWDSALTRQVQEQRRLESIQSVLEVM